MIKNSFSNSLVLFVKNDATTEVRFLNQQSNSFQGELVLKRFHIPTGKELSVQIHKLNFEPNTSGMVLNISETDREVIFVSYLHDKDGNVIHKNIFYPYPWKHAPLPVAHVNKKIISKKNERYLELTSRKPALFVDMYHPKITFSDKGFFLMPREKVLIKMEGKGVNKIEVDEIKIFTLNDYLND